MFIESNDKDEINILKCFDFFDKEFKFYMKPSGYIFLSKNFIETEMFCIDYEELVD